LRSSATPASKDLADLDIQLIEQPVAAGDIAGIAYVGSRSPFPVLADESVFTAPDVVCVPDAGASDLIIL
jgi:L-alanine-DL-glutamate epimerase-like enolase superfamily enzyme